MSATERLRVRIAARMTEDKNLTPFSIADILKSDKSCSGRAAAADDDGDGVAGRAKGCGGALDMTNSAADKCVVKKGKTPRATVIYTSDLYHDRVVPGAYD